MNDRPLNTGRAHAQASSRRRGFTLIELMVAVGISSFMVLVAMAMVHQEVRMLGLSNQTLELSQTSRISLNILSEDLRLAGSGIGYLENGDFAGVVVGPFTRGGATFNSQNRPLNPSTGPTVTDDIGLVFSTGNYATITSFNSGGNVEVCLPIPEDPSDPIDSADPPFEAGEIVLLRSEDALSARTIRVGAPTRGPCIGDAQCASGLCVSYGFGPDNTIQSGPDALTSNYSGGTADGRLQRVTYFVEDSDPRRPTLRRATGDCPVIDSNCGDLMAENFESIQMRVYQLQDDVWTDVTDSGARPNGYERLRVDLELIARSRTQADGPQAEIISRLEPGVCWPACGTPSDRFRRRIMRMSVEIRNAGRLHYRTAHE